MAEQRELTSAFIAFASTQGLILTENDSIKLIADFVQCNHVSLLLRKKDRESDCKLSSRDQAMIALFVREIVSHNARIKEILNHFVEGFILQSALLMKDVNQSHMKFKNLEIFLDSGVLLGALGFKGGPAESAARESFQLLRRTGAYLSVFDKTIDEIRRILSLYEHRLGSSSGKKSLWMNEVTQYFISNNYTPSDVKEAISLLERNIRFLGLNIKETPLRNPKFTCDEEELAGELIDNGEDINEPRVIHDVDCIAAILTTRRGRKTEKIENAVAIFSSGSGMIVKNIQKWFDAQTEGQNIPPIIHHLNRLEEDKKITSDESIAIIANGLTVPLLVRETSDAQNSDAESFGDVIERVKNEYRKEATQEITTERNRAKISAESLRRQRLRLNGLAENISSGIVWFIVSLVSVAAIIGLFLTLPGVASGKTSVPTSTMVAIAGYVLLTISSIGWGCNIKGLRVAAHLWLKEKITLILVVEHETQ